MLVSGLPPHGHHGCGDAGTRWSRRSAGEAVSTALPEVRRCRSLELHWAVATALATRRPRFGGFERYGLT